MRALPRGAVLSAAGPGAPAADQEGSDPSRVPRILLVAVPALALVGAGMGLALAPAAPEPVVEIAEPSAGPTQPASGVVGGGGGASARAGWPISVPRRGEEPRAGTVGTPAETTIDINRASSAELESL